MHCGLRSKRFRIGLLFLFLSCTLAGLLGLAPSGMLIEQPGPILPLVGFGDKDVVKNKNLKTKTGKLIGLSVLLVGTPEARLPVAYVALSMFDRHLNIVPLDEVYPPGTSAEHFGQVQGYLMHTSRDTAVLTAMQRLGIPVLKRVVIRRVWKGMASEGKLFMGDEILSVDNKPVPSLEVLRGAIQNRPLKLEILRSGRVVLIELIPRVDGDRALLGIDVFEKPVSKTSIEFVDGDVGGQSAGLMFAIASYELLSGQGITDGLYISGTGALHPDGRVLEIAGSVQKMWAAYRAGSRIMLLPRKNCPEIRSVAPHDMFAYSVSSFDEAISTIKNLKVGKKELKNRCA
ncbi:S16 family serine protease [Tropheryma whipplei]|uniref:S16 family serine protease n=1 Tax=Tropheryma whipplei TaxID=2039 RepID=UPI0004B88430|nr:S16 family serine protease [Tropheryma whipplei]